MKKVKVTKRQLGAYVRSLLMESSSVGAWEWSGTTARLKDIDKCRTFIDILAASIDGGATSFGNILETEFVNAIKSGANIDFDGDGQTDTADENTPWTASAGELNVEDSVNTPWADAWLNGNPSETPAAHADGYHYTDGVSLSAKGASIIGKDPLVGNTVKVPGLVQLVRDVYRYLEFAGNNDTKGILFKAGLVAFTPKIIDTSDFEAIQGGQVFTGASPGSMFRNPGVRAHIPFNTIVLAPTRHNFAIVSRSQYQNAAAIQYTPEEPAVPASAGSPAVKKVPAKYEPREGLSNPRVTSTEFEQNIKKVMKSRKVATTMSFNNISVLSELAAANRSNILLSCIEAIIGTSLFLKMLETDPVPSGSSQKGSWRKALKTKLKKYPGSFLQKINNSSASPSLTLSAVTIDSDDSERLELSEAFAGLLQTLIQTTINGDPGSTLADRYVLALLNFANTLITSTVTSHFENTMGKTYSGDETARANMLKDDSMMPHIVSIEDDISKLSDQSSLRQVIVNYLSGLDDIQLKNALGGIIFAFDKKIADSKAANISTPQRADFETISMPDYSTDTVVRDEAAAIR